MAWYDPRSWFKKEKKPTKKPKPRTPEQQKAFEKLIGPKESAKTEKVETALNISSSQRSVPQRTSRRSGGGGSSGGSSSTPTTTVKENVIESKVVAVEEPKGKIEKAQQKISEKRSEIQTKRYRGKFTLKNELTSFGLGVGASALYTADFFKSIATDPIGTAKETGKGAYDLFIGGGKLPQVSRTLREDPAFALGFASTEIAQIKAPRVITKTGDEIRTLGLKKLPTEEIIAPEFFKGQKYPAVKKGQTAGELLGEFKQEGAGFTASPKPFAKVTVAGRGSSELPGVYQAPKVSPTFLRVSGEEDKLFSFRIVDTLRPTTTRITPTEFELLPGTKKSQSNLMSPKKAKDFFEIAPKGKSYVPFIKTEKEAIIPFDTSLKKTGRKGYFDFEGRKIPIEEFKTQSKGQTGLKKGKDIKAKDIVGSSSYRKIGKRGKITPYEGSFASRISHSLSSKLSYGKLSSFMPSFNRSKSSSSKSKSLSSRGSYKKSESYSKGLSSSQGNLFYSGSYAGIVNKNFFKGAKLKPISKPSLEIKKKGKRPKSKRKLTRTPDWASVTKFELGLPQFEFSEKLEETGLFPRAYKRRNKK